MKAFTLAQTVQAAGGTYYGNEDMLREIITGVAIDNRNVEPGFLFVPIKGERFDGHDFIGAAYEAGAVCCLSEKKLEVDRPYILVPDTLLAFQKLAAFYKNLFGIQTLSITGSAGKTTTKEMTAAVLAEGFHVLKTEGNFNNQTGVPLTLLRLEDCHDVAVIEMGTNHFGELAQLSKIVRPDCCIITNIGDAHIENFDSREGTLKAKCEMLDFMNPGGTVILNGDDPLLAPLKGRRKNTVLYGLEGHCDVRATDIGENGLLGTEFTVTAAGLPGGARFSVPAPGVFNVRNALGAIAAGLCLGMPYKKLQAGLRNYAPAGSRMRIVQTDYITLMDDTYNANPDSMKAALSVLASQPGRRVCILGDMFELGEQSDTLHYETGQHAAACADLALCVGKNAARICEGAKNAGLAAIHFETQQQLLDRARKLIRPGDTVLIKASRGMELEQTAAFLLGLD